MTAEKVFGTVVLLASAVTIVIMFVEHLRTSGRLHLRDYGKLAVLAAFLVPVVIALLTTAGLVDDDTGLEFSCLGLLVVFVVALVWLLVSLLVSVAKWTWPNMSIVRRPNNLQFLGGLTILVAIAFFVAEILTSTRFVRDSAFIWILVGFPACVLLGRLWWRKYR
jgi:hypothetical protein